MRQVALKLLTATVVGLALVSPVPTFAQKSAPAAASAATRAGFDTQKLQASVGWLKADVDKGRIPGAVVLIARDGEIVLHEAVGWADKTKQIPLARNSIRPIASSTKM